MRNERPLMIAYGDESADQKQERVYAVAVVFGLQSEWDALKEAWLKRTGGKVFHGSDGQSDLTLQRDLVDIILESGLRGFGHAIDLHSQSKWMITDFRESAYHLSLRQVMLHVCGLAHENDVPARRVRFVMDTKKEIIGAAKCIHDYFVNTPEWRYHQALDSDFGFSNREEVGIQVADLYVGELRKWVDDIVSTGSQDQREHLRRLESSKRFGGIAITGSDYFRDWSRALATVRDFSWGLRTRVSGSSAGNGGCRRCGAHAHRMK